jgi:TatD DNase family protein
MRGWRAGVLLDSHAHIDMPEFDADRDAVLRRARESGVAAVITIGIDIASSEAAISLAEKHGDVYATVGIHPHDASKVTEADIARMEELAKHPKVVAIGEIGLDFYRNRSSKESQVDAFKRQLEIASKAGLPVVIHSRNARDEVFEILKDWVTGLKVEDRPAGVLHCFSGDADLGRKYIDMGFLLSFAGPVTYPKSSAANVAKELPLDKMLIETDCPFLAPQAHRGKRNEPAYISYIAAKIAEMKGMSPESVAEITSANAVRLFHLPVKQGVEG